jgi:hypothetical protein
VDGARIDEGEVLTAHVTQQQQFFVAFLCITAVPAHAVPFHCPPLCALVKMKLYLFSP